MPSDVLNIDAKLSGHGRERALWNFTALNDCQSLPEIEGLVPALAAFGLHADVEPLLARIFSDSAYELLSVHEISVGIDRPSLQSMIRGQ